MPRRGPRSAGSRWAPRTGSGTWRVRFPPGTRRRRPDEGQADGGARFAGDASVAWAEPDWVVAPLGTAADADFARQWNLAAVGAPDAWDATRGSSGVVVGVVDTGVVDHPDLQGQLVAGYDFISEPGDRARRRRARPRPHGPRRRGAGERALLVARDARRRDHRRQARTPVGVVGRGARAAA